MVIACRMVIECIDVVRMLHFTLHDHISCWLRYTLPMYALLAITGAMRFLKIDAHE